MATLTAMTFHSLSGAGEALAMVEQLQRDELMDVLDAAVIRWPRRARKPDAHTQAATGDTPLDNSFWRLLIGIIFLARRFEAGASGAVAGSLSDIGIDEVFVRDVRAHATPGSSALFLLSNGAVTDRVIEALDVLNPSIIATNLPKPKLARLLEIFAPPPPAGRSTTD